MIRKHPNWPALLDYIGIISSETVKQLKYWEEPEVDDYGMILCGGTGDAECKGLVRHCQVQGVAPKGTEMMFLVTLCETHWNLYAEN